MNRSKETMPTAVSEAEKTLRMLAKLPAPAGLEDRMHAALRTAPRRAVVLEWPRQSARNWMRGAAAAAIVAVVAGGGWGIAAKFHPEAPAKVIAMPRVTAGEGFSTAGAMRTPQTLTPTITVKPADKMQPKAVHPKTAKKASPSR